MPTISSNKSSIAFKDLPTSGRGEKIVDPDSVPAQAWTLGERITWGIAHNLGAGWWRSSYETLAASAVDVLKNHGLCDDHKFKAAFKRSTLEHIKLQRELPWLTKPMLDRIEAGANFNYRLTDEAYCKPHEIVRKAISTGTNAQGIGNLCASFKEVDTPSIQGDFKLKTFFTPEATIVFRKEYIAQNEVNRIYVATDEHGRPYILKEHRLLGERTEKGKPKPRLTRRMRNIRREDHVARLQKEADIASDVGRTFGPLLVFCNAKQTKGYYLQSVVKASLDQVWAPFVRGVGSHRVAVAFVAREVARDLAIVHGKKIAHFDIKFDNIGVAKNSVFLMDFDRSMHLGDKGTVRPQGRTANKSPLEQKNGEKCGPSSDMFAYGILLAEMVLLDPRAKRKRYWLGENATTVGEVTGSVTSAVEDYYAYRDRQPLREDKAGYFNESHRILGNFSKQLNELVTELLAPNQHLRPTIESVNEQRLPQIPEMRLTADEERSCRDFFQGLSNRSPIVAKSLGLLNNAVHSASQAGSLVFGPAS